MAVELWPPISPEDLQKAEEEDLKRELKWLVDELRDGLQAARHGLEDCYALLAPVDPGSTLPLTTPGKELVKGVMTRVGSRITRGTIHIRPRTLQPQTLSIDLAHPIHITPLLNLTNLLNQAIDMLTLTLSVAVNANFLHAQLRLLAGLISDASAIIKGPPLIPASRDWTTESVSPLHFSPPLGHTTSSGSASVFSSSGSIRAGVFGHESSRDPLCPSMSVHIGLRNGNIVFSLRALEPVSAPVGLGTKLALAIGTTRRLEHDEADRIFTFTSPAEPRRPGSSAGIVSGSSIASGLEGSGSNGVGRGALGHSSPFWRRNLPQSLHDPSGGASSFRKCSSSMASSDRKREVEVYVREKIEIETGDPSLISVELKLKSIGAQVALARKNLAAALGVTDDEEGLDDMSTARLGTAPRVGHGAF